MKKQVYYLILLTVFIIGIILRTVVFLYHSEFEDDECRLLLAISGKSFWQMFLSLGLAQSAPPFFLVLVKCWSKLCNQAEYFMHSLPFIFSLCSMFAFFKLSEKLFKHKYSIILANILFGLNYSLIFFSSILKQYSLDVFVSIILVYFLSEININKLSKKGLYIFSLLLLILPFISLPSLIFIGSFFILRIIYEYKNKGFIKKFIVLILPFLIIMTLYYFFNLAPSKADLDKIFPNYWRNGFLTIESFKYLRLFAIYLKTHFYPNSYILFELILWVLGIFYCIKDKSSISKYILCVFAVANLAALMQLYPFAGRVALYFVPILIIFCVKPLDSINIKNLRAAILLTFCYVIGFCGYNINYVKDNIVGLKHNICYPKSVLQKLIVHYNSDNDVILYNQASISNFIYYSQKLNFYPVKDIPLFNKTKDDITKFIDNLDSNYNYWLYCSKDYSRAKIVDDLMEYANGKHILYKFTKGKSKVVLFKK